QAGTSKTRQNALLLVVLLFAQLLLMTGSVRRSSGSTQLESWAMTITSPLVSIGHAIGGGIDRVFDGVADLVNAHGRSARLERENRALRSELRRAREAGAESDRLRQLLMMREALAPNAIGASVVISRHTATERMLVLDRGSDDGVTVDLAVVAWGGAVGRVIEVGKSHAKVRLLTDPNSGIAGIVQRSRAQGMVQGDGSDTLKFVFVSRLEDVVNGDRTVASGAVGIFPRGFGIGRVSAIEEKPDGSREIELVPEIDYRTVEEVLVLLEPQGGEWLLPPGLREPGT
ncbi:MAG: rod shape-determining protein MreC, partial [Acidobacteria bacterium]|nr:rod shape-determining protein MreC [Acidobacteriota bacterium]NIQ84223.1 rod shape-determining protein MreC [Acidobacteriota bacterium]